MPRILPVGGRIQSSLAATQLFGGACRPEWDTMRACCVLDFHSRSHPVRSMRKPTPPVRPVGGLVRGARNAGIEGTDNPPYGALQLHVHALGSDIAFGCDPQGAFDCQ